MGKKTDVMIMATGTELLIPDTTERVGENVVVAVAGLRVVKQSIS